MADPVELHGPIEVRFVSGAETGELYPDDPEAKALQWRFAVVQETYVPDWYDGLYFEEPLWRSLVAFVRSHDPAGSVTVISSLYPKPTKEVPLADFLDAWERTTEDDRDAPAAVILRSAGRLTLYLQREYWDRLGGPTPYHDSHTFSIFSEVDLSRKIMAHLANDPNAPRWDLAAEPLPAIPNYGRKPKPFRNRIFEWTFYALVLVAFLVFLHFDRR